MNDSGLLTVSMPSYESKASDAPQTTVSWSPADLRSSLAAEFGALPGAHAACKPDAAMLKALEVVTERCPATYRKAITPALFLACAIFSRNIFGAGDDNIKPFPGLRLSITKATLPVGAGLGSSASVSVSLAAALLEVYQRWTGGAWLQCYTPTVEPSTSNCREAGRAARPLKAALALVNAWAYSSEMLFHGSPSGLDNTVATYGGAIAYKRIMSVDAATGASVPTGQTTIEHIDSMPPLRILITNTKVPKETSKLVAGVRVLHDELPSVVKPILSSIQAIASEVIDGIRQETQPAAAGSAAASASESASSASSSALVPSAIPEISLSFHSKLQKLMRINHSLLNGLGVGHAALDTVVAASARHGLAGKLTGAGGGGCAITLLPPHYSRSSSSSATDNSSVIEENAATAALVASLSSEFSSLGWDCFETQIGGSGVVVW